VATKSLLLASQIDECPPFVHGRDGIIANQSCAPVTLHQLPINLDGGVIACNSLRMAVQIAQFRALVTQCPRHQQSHSVATAFEVLTGKYGFVLSFDGIITKPTTSQHDSIVDGGFRQFNCLCFTWFCVHGGGACGRATEALTLGRQRTQASLL